MDQTKERYCKKVVSHDKNTLKKAFRFVPDIIAIPIMANIGTLKYLLDMYAINVPLYDTVHSFLKIIILYELE